MASYIVNGPTEIGSSGNTTSFSGTQVTVGGNSNNLTLTGLGGVVLGGTRTTTLTGNGGVVIAAGGVLGSTGTDTNLVMIGGSSTTLAGSGSVCVGSSTDSVLFQPTNPHLYLKGMPTIVNHNTVYNTPSTITASDLCGGNIEFTSSGSYTLPTTANIAIELLDVNSTAFSSNIFPVFGVTFYNNTAGSVTLNFGTGQTYSGGSSITLAATTIQTLRFVFSSISSILIEAGSSTTTTLTNAGTTSLVNDGTGPTLATKGLIAGTGISFTESATDVTITNSSPASSVTLTNAGTTSLVNDGTGPTLATKGLVAGTGISFTTTAANVTITNSSPASSVTLTNAGTTTLVNDGTGPTLATKGLIAGTGISFTESATDVTIVNSSPASSVTLTNSGTTSLVNNGTGPALTTKGLVAGTGVSFTTTATDVTITNSSPASSVTLTNAGTTTLVNSGTGPALATKGLVAGTGISFGTTATNVTITNSSPASSVTLTNSGTTSLVNNGTGPALTTKGLVAGTGITFSTTATNITINASFTASEPLYTSNTRAIISGTSNTFTNVNSASGGCTVGGTANNVTIASTTGGVCIGGTQLTNTMSGAGSVTIGGYNTGGGTKILSGAGSLSVGGYQSSGTHTLSGTGVTIVGGQSRNITLDNSTSGATGSTSIGGVVGVINRSDVGCTYIGSCSCVTQDNVTSYAGATVINGGVTFLTPSSGTFLMQNSIVIGNCQVGLQAANTSSTDQIIVIGSDANQYTLSPSNSTVPKLYVRSSPIICPLITLITTSTALTVDVFAYGIVYRNTGSGTVNLTLPTAANMYTGLIDNSGAGFPTNGGFTVTLIVINQGTSGNVVIVTNTGITLSGTTTIAVNVMRRVIYTMLSASTAAVTVV